MYIIHLKVTVLAIVQFLQLQVESENLDNIVFRQKLVGFQTVPFSTVKNK